jgi:hypothetical protein
VKKRVMGIEPTPQAWEARVLPLNYTRDTCYIEPFARQAIRKTGFLVFLWVAGEKLKKVLAHHRVIER